MKYKYQVSVFSNYYPTVALFEHEGEAIDYFEGRVKEYGDEYLITLTKLETFHGEAEYPLIEWY